MCVDEATIRDKCNNAFIAKTVTGPAKKPSIHIIQLSFLRLARLNIGLLYPFIDVKQLHHVDHVYPKGLLTRGKLERAGLDGDTANKCIDARNSLPNLQLLEGLLNITKSDKPPMEWQKLAYPDDEARQAVIERHDLGKVPETGADFLPFLDARREKIRGKLFSLLGDGSLSGGSNEA